MLLKRLFALSVVGIPLMFFGCGPTETAGKSQTGGDGADEGGSHGGGTGGARKESTAGKSGGPSAGSNGSEGGNSGSNNGGSNGGGSGGGGGSSAGNGGSSSSGAGGSGGAAGGAGGSASSGAGGSGGMTGVMTSSNCPGTAITVDWTTGRMDATANPAIHGTWYTYGDTNGTTYTPATKTVVNTNCLTGSIAAAGWGAGFGFTVNQTSIAPPAVWAMAPSKLCFEVEITGAALWLELPMSKADVHSPPYGQELKAGVNVVELSKVKPTWIDPMKTSPPWNVADVAEVHLKVAKPGKDFKLCVKGLSVIP